MVRVRKSTESDEVKPSHKALSPEARENQMISLAMDLVEERLKNGTASSAETVHFLRLGSTKQREEIEKLKAEVKLAEAKVEVLESSKHSEELYQEAIKAFKSYNGSKEDEDV